MKLPSIFKTSKNKSYNYTPRYYNPRHDRESASEGTPKISMRRVRFKEEWKTQQARGDKKQRIRLVIIVFILFAIAIFVLKQL